MAQSLRTLTEEEKEKLAKDVNLITEFKQNKFEKEAQKNWDIFYKRNTTKFFKDRHWTRREFGELINSSDEESLVVFEVGCGVGNFMFPLMSEDKNMYFYACDFSHRAVQFVKENPCYDPSRCTVFQCDIVNDDLTNQMPEEVVDVATMIFVLSAIHPEKMAVVLRKIYRTLKPGGCLLIRDYGLYDYAMLRFAPGHKLSENFYVRQDGTRAYYFSLEVLDSLMRSSGFEVARSEYIHRQTVNKKEGLEVPRIFVQGKYVKPYGKIAQSAENETSRDGCINCEEEKASDICLHIVKTGAAENSCMYCLERGNHVSKDSNSTGECRFNIQEAVVISNSELIRLNDDCATEILCDNVTDNMSGLSVERNCDLTQRKIARSCDNAQEDFKT